MAKNDWGPLGPPSFMRERAPRKVVKRAGPKASDMPLGDYLRWLATTLGSESLVVAELNARAEAADSLLAACKQFVECRKRGGGAALYTAAEDAAIAAIAKAQPAKKGGGHG